MLNNIKFHYFTITKTFINLFRKLKNIRYDMITMEYLANGESHYFQKKSQNVIRMEDDLMVKLLIY
jgi:hypothetical protein